jgi:hypothetical protein
MKQPAAILVLQYWYTILVIPIFYQYLPVSAILVQILVKVRIRLCPLVRVEEKKTRKYVSQNSVEEQEKEERYTSIIFL